MPAGLGFLKGLSTALETYQDQIDRQKQMKLAQIELQQKQVELQAMQQQAQLAGWQGKVNIAGALAEAQGDQPQAPPVQPYSINQPAPGQGGSPAPMGLPGAQPMPGGGMPPQGGGSGATMAPMGTMGPAPGAMMPGGRPLPGMAAGGQGMAPQGQPMMRPPMQGAPQGGMQGGMQPQGIDALPPPPTVYSLTQAITQRAQQQGMQIPLGQAYMLAQKAYPQKMQEWNARREQLQYQQSERDRMLMHEETEEDRRLSRAETAQAHADAMAMRQATLDLTRTGMADRGWTIVTDKNGDMYRVNAGTGETVKWEGAPKGMQKMGAPVGASDDDIKQTAKNIANYQEPPVTASRGNGPKIMAEVTRLNPDYDAKKYQQYQRGYVAFTSGPQGNVVRSLGVADSHLGVLSDAVKSLKNGDINLLNAFRQRWAQETGSPAPTTFDGIKSIVADEVAKAVIGGQTAQADREKLAESLRKINSPSQLEGVIKGYRQLMAGQLSGLRRQYKAATNRDDFDTLIPSNMAGGAASSDRSTSQTDYSHLWSQ